MEVLRSILLFTFLSCSVAFAEDEHTHEHGHSEKHEEAHADEHGDKHEESSPIVGAEKGITSFNAEGFTLSSEATASFAIQTLDVKGAHLTLPKDALVTVKDTVSIFRLRENRYKRISVKILKKNGSSALVESPSLKSSDKVITRGAAFLRVAEIAAEGGVSHGHSH
ncbi:MAG: hypothetical protein AB7F59_04210 [Bdellovibrionales bacterium]